MNKKDPLIISPSSLFIFNKTRLAMLCVFSTVAGIVFFLCGFFIGYNSGANDVFVKHNLIPVLKIPVVKNEKKDSPFTHLVYFGAYSKPEHALSAWQEVEQYSRLSERQAIIKTRVKNENYYQVLVDSFQSQEEARAFAQTISNNTDGAIVPIVKKMLKKQSPISNVMDK